VPRQDRREARRARRPERAALLDSLLIESFDIEERAADPVYALGRDLGLAAVPRSFVCVDISTNQGRDTVGSLVWFEGGRPRKAEYRRFRIRGAGQQDDFAAIHEVVTRYLTRRRDEELPVPDLMVIDGGKGQLGAALDASREVGFGDLPVVSLAKREEEVCLPGRAEPLRLPRRSPSLRLLQRARDEAHRFAVTYSRKRRTARTITSELLRIPGVGPARRRLLLERFGSLAGVRSASAAEIAAAGFRGLAERILDRLGYDERAGPRVPECGGPRTGGPGVCPACGPVLVRYAACCPPEARALPATPRRDVALAERLSLRDDEQPRRCGRRTPLWRSPGWRSGTVCASLSRKRA
jgi:excinuclease UvrABC nuclease subunit